VSTPVAPVPADTVGAFVGVPSLLDAGSGHGPLVGATVGVKDLFDVAGTVTGAGTPAFAAGRPPAPTHAEAVARLVAAGAGVVGKTITDELAYSLAGTNVHLGTPINVAAPGRVPGGSSSGSAAAVAAGLVDLGLGTDTGGSIRVPASACGVLGWRPTHGAVPLDGVVPLSPSFDTVGLLARDPWWLRAGAEVLLGSGAAAAPNAGPQRLLLVAEALAEVGPALADEVRRGAAELAVALGVPLDEASVGIDLAQAFTAFRALQAREAWRSHGAWIRAVDPDLGPGIRARFEAAAYVTADEVAEAELAREALVDALDAATDGAVLLLPAAPGAAPPIVGGSADPAAHADRRSSTLRLTAPAGLAGAPVVVVPVLADEGLPLGLALQGARGSDLALLDLAVAALG
jgi:amidase